MRPRKEKTSSEKKQTFWLQCKGRNAMTFRVTTSGETHTTKCMCTVPMWWFYVTAAEPAEYTGLWLGSLFDKVEQNLPIIALINWQAERRKHQLTFFSATSLFFSSCFILFLSSIKWFSSWYTGFFSWLEKEKVAELSSKAILLSAKGSRVQCQWNHF